MKDSNASYDNQLNKFHKNKRFTSFKSAYNKKGFVKKECLNIIFLRKIKIVHYKHKKIFKPNMKIIATQVKWSRY